MRYKNIYLVDAVRTPIGSFCGALAKSTAVELAAPLVKALLERKSLSEDSIDEVIVGSVLTANQGQAPGRQVAVKSGLPDKVSAVTVNKVCSSGLFACMMASRNIMLGISDVVIAGGMESMSQAPFYLPQLRAGAKLGHQTLIDSIIKDGLWDVYNDYHMGCAGELCARTYNFSREAQDDFAIQSYEKALNSIRSGKFKSEIIPIEISSGKSNLIVDQDEEPFKFDKDKAIKLKPSFDSNGTITAANASSLNDGASLLLIVSEGALKKYNLTPRARILSEGCHSQAPEWFTTAPVIAMSKAMESAGLKKDDFKYFEINEAFSAVTMACIKDLSLDAKLVNVRGGAVALGHPIGASGARILCTLLNSLESDGGGRGLVGICNGGGEATALAIETL